MAVYRVKALTHSEVTFPEITAVSREHAELIAFQRIHNQQGLGTSVSVEFQVEEAVEEA